MNMQRRKLQIKYGKVCFSESYYYVGYCMYPDKLGEGLIDEDKGDEDGEDLLGETRDEADQEAALRRHDHHHDDDEPHAHPHSPHDVLNFLSLTELQDKQTYDGHDVDCA